jgi:hypothetical protein
LKQFLLLFFPRKHHNASHSLLHENAEKVQRYTTKSKPETKTKAQSKAPCDKYSQGKKAKKKRIYYALYVSTVSDSTKLLICMHYAVCTVSRDAIRKVRFQYQMMYEIVEQVA